MVNNILKSTLAIISMCHLASIILQSLHSFGLKVGYAQTVIHCVREYIVQCAYSCTTSVWLAVNGSIALGIAIAFPFLHSWDFRTFI